MAADDTLLEVVRKLSAVETKIDIFINKQNSSDVKIAAIEADLSALKSEIKGWKSKFAGAAAVISAAMVFLVPFVKNKLGL